VISYVTSRALPATVRLDSCCSGRDPGIVLGVALFLGAAAVVLYGTLWILLIAS
jgi:hypothetical protein